ncbi:hypothetical protein [Streptodolium elevatio]|uniref:Uncharacterized protein n=1 Tax=Streptodolium elevatio TaxID=3157996 RepID=A0ABV3D8W2_9ACTN
MAGQREWGAGGEDHDQRGADHEAQQYGDQHHQDDDDHDEEEQACAGRSTE